MSKSPRIRRYLLSALLALSPAAWATPSSLGGSGAFADPSAGTWVDPSAAAVAGRGVERKTPSWFRSGPSAPTPLLQLARARRIELAGDLRDATRAYDALVRAWPESREAVAAQRAVARLFEARRRHARAFDEYLYLLTFYADRFPASEALERMFAIANHFRAEGSEERARTMFTRIAEVAPQWTRTPAARLQLGLLEEADGELETAALTFERLLSSHPGTAEARDAAAQAAFCRARLARRYARDDAACQRALSALSMALRDYPDHPQREALQAQLDEFKVRRAGLAYAAAAFYDAPGRPPAQAATAYREFLRRHPDAPQADSARRRLDVLAPPPTPDTPEGVPTP